jgi:hypothetical protein
MPSRGVDQNAAAGPQTARAGRARTRKPQFTPLWRSRLQTAFVQGIRRSTGSRSLRMCCFCCYLPNSEAPHPPRVRRPRGLSIEQRPAFFLITSTFPMASPLRMFIFLAAMASSCSALMVGHGVGLATSSSSAVRAVAPFSRSRTPVLKRSAEERDVLELEGTTKNPA